jgi:hypothetical protein
MMRARFIGYGVPAVLVWLTCSCCHHSAESGTRASVPEAAAAGSPVLRPIEYVRTGGIMGTDDHIDVTTGGDVHVRGRMFGRREGHLTAEQQGDLAAAFAGWDRLANDYPAGGVADTFQYQIRFDGKKVTADQAAQVPHTFTRAREKLESVAESLPREQ